MFCFGVWFGFDLIMGLVAVSVFTVWVVGDGAK